MLCEEKEFHWERFYLLQSNLESLIETTKQQYCSKNANKLSDHSISSKIYWSVLKRFLAGKAFLYSTYFSWNQIWLQHFADESVLHIIFTDNNIGKMARGLDHNKAHNKSLQRRRWFCKLRTFFKIYNNKFPCIISISYYLFKTVRALQV